MDIDYEDLYKWIDSHVITRPKRNLNRDFADAVPLAEILKQHYPKLVELHNYSPGNAFSIKMINWDTLNRRVLNKLNINLTKKSREDLALGKPGAIGNLLALIKSKIEIKEAAGDKQHEEKVFYFEDSSNFTAREDVVPIKINNGTQMLDRKLVPAETFEKMEKDILEKQETITHLANKVDHLEKLIAIKDERIKDLTQQIQSIINSTGESTSNLVSPKARFFNNLF